MNSLKVRKAVDLLILSVVVTILPITLAVVLSIPRVPGVSLAPSFFAIVGIPLVVTSVIIGLFFPRRFEVVGSVARLYAPFRREEYVVRQFVGEVEDPGVWKRWFFCFGWRFPFTSWAYCGDKIYFSTFSCKDRWKVFKVEKGGEERELWLCG